MRELAEAGYGVLGVSDELAPGLWSRRATLGTWRTREPGRLVERLGAFARTQVEPPILMPTSDAYIELVIAHAAELSDFRFQSSYSDGIAASFLDKERFYELCDAHGMHQPRRMVFHDRGEAMRLVDGSVDPVPFPAILKPSEVHHVKHLLRGRKVIVVRDRPALVAALRDLPFETTSWLLQEVVPGPETELVELAVYIDRAGRAVRTVTGRKLRQFPIGFGSTSLARTESIADVRSVGLAFLKAVGFKGIGHVEFKRDPRDGRLRMIEINSRPALWFQLAHTAGVDIVAAAADDLSGRPVAPAKEQRDGVRWQYGLKDAYSSTIYRLRPTDSLFPAPEVGSGRSRSGALWDRRDPLPAIAEPLLYAVKAVRRRRPLKAGRAGPPD